MFLVRRCQGPFASLRHAAVNQILSFLVHTLNVYALTGIIRGKCHTTTVKLVRYRRESGAGVTQLFERRIVNDGD
jgi:hypothetical protein